MQPVSLLFRGRIEHRDSLGTHRKVESGGMQWLVSGAGAFHEEVLGGDDEGIFHMAQLWVNVPAARKMDPPEHHALPASAIPQLRELGPGSQLRLYAGRIGDVVGPAPLPTPVLIAHLQLEAGGSATIPVPRQWTAAFTVVAGSVDGQSPDELVPGSTVDFESDGDALRISSRSGGELLLMCGEPIGEPIAMGGGFVMNTQDEIEDAFDDMRTGKMGSLSPSR